MQKRTDFFDNSLLSIVPDIPLVIRNKPHNNQLCTDLSRLISAYPVVSHFLRFAWQTTVISNNAWSGEAIKERFDRLLPNNRFEFIISSCDYMIRKPDKRLFEIALMKSGLTSDKVWYCGDSYSNDVVGANNAGIFPVYYSDTNNNANADFEFLSVRDWREMIETLQNL